MRRCLRESIQPRERRFVELYNIAPSDQSPYLVGLQARENKLYEILVLDFMMGMF